MMVTWETMAKRHKEMAEVFEKKFIDYRNKMLAIHDNLEDGDPLKKEIEKAQEHQPFKFLDWNDQWLDSTFRACIEKAKPKMKVYTQCTYTILEFKVDETLPRKELEKRDIHANEAVMVMMDALKTFGSIRIAH